jgi:spore germination cell wall hydrolase CwlJ-like protein
MNRTILALLFTVALTGAAQACGWNNFNASAEAVAGAQNNPVLPPVAEQTNRSQHGAGVSASSTLDNLGDIDGTPLNLAASTIMSWTHKIKTFLDTRFIQENCLATAVYFEARSESQLGQLAVATVILNRVQASKSSSSICGVVYKGASHLNSCQFSFACDGKLDLVDDTRAWKTARTVTALALADNTEMKDGRMQILATATNYHTDYVDPYWSKSLTRLTKIGHHIFYSQS